MKMEINKENKEKFFTQYWGQHVLCSSNWDNTEPAMICTPYFEGDNSGHYLRLKPLSSITDEEATEVARISLSKDDNWVPLEIVKWDWCWKVIVNREVAYYDPKINLEMHFKIDFEVNINEIFFTWDHISDTGVGHGERHIHNAIGVYDYLRSRGFALPWMGLTVEQMVEAQWIKLIES